MAGKRCSRLLLRYEWLNPKADQKPISRIPYHHLFGGFDRLGSDRSFLPHSQEDLLCLLGSEMAKPNEDKANECMGRPR